MSHIMLLTPTRTTPRGAAQNASSPVPARVRALMNHVLSVLLPHRVLRRIAALFAEFEHLLALLRTGGFPIPHTLAPNPPTHQRPAREDTPRATNPESVPLTPANPSPRHPSVRRPSLRQSAAPRAIAARPTAAIHHPRALNLTRHPPSLTPPLLTHATTHSKNFDAPGTETPHAHIIAKTEYSDKISSSTTTASPSARRHV